MTRDEQEKTEIRSGMRRPAKGFEDLVVWQKAHSFVIDIYRLTQSFPQHEAYGLTSQIRRSAISIPANIAEGFKKRSKADKVRFLNIAQGSLEDSLLSGSYEGP